MAFPPGSNVNSYKHLFNMDESSSSSSSSSSDEVLEKKLVFLAKETKGKNKKIVQFDRKIAELQLKQRKLMVTFNELERELKNVIRDRKKAIKRLKEDECDSFTKATKELKMSLKMTHREAIKPPKKKKKRAPTSESSSSDSASEAEEDNSLNDLE